MNVSYNPATLPAVLAVQYSRFGGLTLAELEMLEELNGGRATPGMFEDKPRINVEPILQAFKCAHSKGGTVQPTMRIEGFVLKYATRGATPGAIFVTGDEFPYTYFGKFMGNTFQPSQACTSAHKDAILQAAADPLEAIVAFGRKTGKCSICHRPLSDPESVQAGVGPICRKKFGL